MKSHKSTQTSQPDGQSSRTDENTGRRKERRLAIGVGGTTGEWGVLLSWFVELIAPGVGTGGAGTVLGARRPEESKRKDTCRTRGPNT